MKSLEHLALLAQATTPQDSALDRSGLTTLNDRILGLLGQFQDLVLQVGSGVIVIMVMIAGYRYITGDPKSGKSGIMAAVIGTAIVLLSYAIIGWICSATGGGCSVK